MNSDDNIVNLNIYISLQKLMINNYYIINEQ